jgi:uncharacterized protein
MTGYHISRFAIQVPVVSPEDHFTALYHTLTQALVLIPSAQWETIVVKAQAQDPKVKEMLASQGFLLNGEVDETILFIQWKDRHVHDFTTLRSKNLVTRQCNNHCTYCIIKPEAGVMSAQTAQAVDAFYLEQIERHQPLQVRDNFLGGEPLLNIDVIEHSAGRRFYFCRGRGIDYRFSITTNGTLLGPKVAARLKAVGLTDVRVSIAGPGPVHDALRPLKNGAGTYAVIMENLERMDGLVDLWIECQYDAGCDDYKRIPEMLDDMNRRGISVSGISFTPILARRRANRYWAGMGKVEKYLYLIQQARNRGIHADNTPPTNACMTDFRSAFVFDTEGSLIPCPSLQGGEMAYGSVTGGIDFVAESQLLARRLPEKCLKRCELLPVCMGGCRLQAMTSKGDFNGIDCQYETHRLLTEAYIRDCAASALAEETSAT